MVTWMNNVVWAAKNQGIRLFAGLFGAGVHDQLWTRFL